MTNVDTAVTAQRHLTRLYTEGRTCAVYG